MTQPMEARWTARAAGWLPAVFWILYTLWNTVLPGPPAFGGFTVLQGLYLLMLPAAVAAAVRWPRPHMSGQWAYVAFVAWMALGVLWYDPASEVQVVKSLFVAGLAAIVAAQVLIGGWQAQVAFAAGVIATAVALSAWAVLNAFATGFSYRSGLPINPNFVATMIGPGLLTSVALYLHGGATRQGPVLAIILTCFYASLLLGSRGVLIALLAGAAVLVARLRPSLRQTRPLLVGLVVVTVIAQLPVIPATMWRTGWRAASWARASVARIVETTSSTERVTETVPPPATESSFDPAAAAMSTAIARFFEKDTGSFNLRSALWIGALSYSTSTPMRMLFGGGIGTSGAVAEAANPVFHNAHNAFLQVLVDFGLLGAGLLTWLFWSLTRKLASGTKALSMAWLAVLVFWLVTGLTATVMDLHVFWVTLGVAAASTASTADRLRQASVDERAP